MNVWTWGANSYGQLALGNDNDQLLPQRVSNLPANVKHTSGGGGHTLVITDSGELYTCGSNDKGQLGLNTMMNVSTLTHVAALSKHKISMATGGWDFSLALTDSGELYCWGSNAFGQLGDPDLPSKCLLPTRVLLGKKIISVAAGLRHSVVLTDDGDVYCWGNSKRGQCGVVSDSKLPVKVTTPYKVSFPEGIGQVISIAAGSYHTVALTDQGRVSVWGCNKYGQSTKDPKIVPQENTPYVISQELFGGESVTAVKSGWTHLLAQTETKVVYSWGRGDYGQLGRSRSPGVSYLHIPGVVEASTQIKQFVCGSEHNIFVSENQELYTFGWNEHGLCATGDEVNVEAVYKVKTLEHQCVINIGCGSGHCFATAIDKTDFG